MKKLTRFLSGLSMMILVIILANCASKNGTDPASVAAGSGNGTSKAGYAEVTSFGSNPGGLKMYAYIPANLPANAGLVVALHGCTQTASEYATRTEWNKLADKYNFYVVYPEQNSSNNQNKCFNWFETADISRGQGEALSIKQMVDKMKSTYSIDASRVFVTGLSAGGYMTPVMMATYPDVFAAGAVMAGGPYKCATSMTNAFSCMSPGVDKTPAAWKSIVTGAYSSYTGKYPRLIVFQGASDYTVKSLNMTELVDQWTAVHNADQNADLSETFRTHEHKQYKNAAGDVVVETYLLAGMGHAITVDPGTDADQGGSTGAYAEDKNIYSSYYALKFFKLDNRDQEVPVVVITAPVNNYATAVGETSLVVSANASDNVGVAKVEFYVGGILKATDTTAPYSFTWANGSENKGTYAIKAVAYDAAGNMGSSEISVINNTGLVDVTAPVITSDKASGTYDSSVTVALSANEAATIYYSTDGTTPSESSAVYSTALTFSDSKTLKFFGKDAAGNKSDVQTLTFTINTVLYSETSLDTATNHYLAKRLDVSGYIKYGGEYGYVNKFTLYKLKSTGKWVDIHDVK